MKFTEEVKDKIFFTSDNHFHHENIIKFCSRPFYDTFDMNQKLIDNWNSVVPEDGIVFHGGDFIMTGRKALLEEILYKLNGKIYLVLGNHDYKNRLDRKDVRTMFHDTTDMYQFTIEDNSLINKHINFIITHYPFMFWRRGYYHLHGHVHSGPLSTASEKVAFHAMRYDIGVDNNGFTPISYKQLITKLEIT